MNVGTAPSVAVPPYVNDPVVSTKLVLGFIVPLEKLKLGPLMVNVVQAMVPIFDKVPPVYVTAAEQVRLYVAKSNVPAVMANVVQFAALPMVTVKVVLIVNGPNDALLKVYVTLACGTRVSAR